MRKKCCGSKSGCNRIFFESVCHFDKKKKKNLLVTGHSAYERPILHLCFSMDQMRGKWSGKRDCQAYSLLACDVLSFFPLICYNAQLGMTLWPGPSICSVVFCWPQSLHSILRPKCIYSCSTCQAWRSYYLF